MAASRRQAWSTRSRARSARCASIPDSPFAKLAALARPAEEVDAPMPGEERQRIDKWLFFARVVKSRSLAAKLVPGRACAHQSREGRAGRASGQARRRAHHHARPPRPRLARASTPGTRRGPAEEAQHALRGPVAASRAERRAPLRRDRPRCARPAAAARPRRNAARLDRLSRRRTTSTGYEQLPPVAGTAGNAFSPIACGMAVSAALASTRQSALPHPLDDGSNSGTSRSRP